MATKNQTKQKKSKVSTMFKSPTDTGNFGTDILADIAKYKDYMQKHSSCNGPSNAEICIDSLFSVTLNVTVQK